MPHLAFYALPVDIGQIARFALDEAGCDIFERRSRPDCTLRKFGTAEEVVAAAEDSNGGLSLSLYAPTMRGSFTIERIAFQSDAVPGKSWAEQLSGWGLISVECTKPMGERLGPSSMNHNTEKRARTWEATYSELPPVAVWDFAEVARISRRVNHHVRTRLAVRKVGSRVVLAAADEWERSGQGSFAIA